MRRPKTQLTEVERERQNRRLVEASSSNIQYILNPSEAVQIAAVSKGCSFIQYIDNPSEVVQRAALDANWLAVEFIRNPSEDIQLYAVKRNPVALRFIRYPSEAVKYQAIAGDGEMIRFIVEPSEALQNKAVETNGYVLAMIANPSLRTIASAMRATPCIVFDGAFIAQITPAILDELYPGLAAQVEVIKTLEDNTQARAELFNAFYAPIFDAAGQHTTELALPTGLAL